METHDFQIEPGKQTTISSPSRAIRVHVATVGGTEIETIIPPNVEMKVTPGNDIQKIEISIEEDLMPQKV